jgi:hypothetical protein
MSKCPHCKQNITINELKRDTLGSGIFMQEIMYSCPLCDTVISISRGKYR